MDDHVDGTSCAKAIVVEPPAGFWIRFCAAVIDLAAVAAAVILVAQAVAGWGMYLPIEAVTVGAFAAYAAGGVVWRGQTLGKAVLGVRVTRRDGGCVGWDRALVRSALVAGSLVLLGLPLLTIVAGASKRGWHDRLAGTTVVCLEGRRRQRRFVFGVVMIVVGVFVGGGMFRTYRLYGMHRAWVADADAAADGRQDVVRDTIEVSSVDAAQRAEMAAWLAEHAEDPAQTVIDLASAHRVTIVGEIHHKKAYLRFFKEIIPDLYRKAGVRTLALECCHADQNRALARLVEAPQFDRRLLLAIARRGPWRAWGDKEYWDVLETVWRVNHSRPAGQEPLRVVGIHPRFDTPSLVLVYDGPWYEKLRIVRLGGPARVFLGEAYYARCVEREAFDQGRRTVVWVGAAHAVLCPSGGKGGALRFNHCMGSMLAGRYGGAVGHAILHPDIETNRVARLIEESARLGPTMRVAFTPTDSPFARLCDGDVDEYGSRPGAGLADLVSHYIMLMPTERLDECDWMEGFLSRRMLGENRPYYEYLAGGAIADVNDGNRRIRDGARRL